VADGNKLSLEQRATNSRARLSKLRQQCYLLHHSLD